ncbi:MAG: hypothetical protein QHH07_03005, partial [Sedimentisphaerales bacterium]|nr:hypothetical protein [Sedimentisphaerales bacterium]
SRLLMARGMCVRGLCLGLGLAIFTIPDLSILAGPVEDIKQADGLLAVGQFDKAEGLYRQVLDGSSDKDQRPF